MIAPIERRDFVLLNEVIEALALGLHKTEGLSRPLAEVVEKVAAQSRLIDALILAEADYERAEDSCRDAWARLDDLRAQLRASGGDA